MSAGDPAIPPRPALSLVELEAAWDEIAACVHPLPPESIPLTQAAGRVLAADVFAADDQPPFDKAMMDGFAVRSADVTGAGATLDIAGLAQAGGNPLALTQGMAARINTGAALPQGADAVIRIEDASISADSRRVTFSVAAAPGRHVGRRAGVRHRGDIVLAAPVTLEAAQIGAAAAAGADRVEVFPQPGVAIVSTGDELMPIGAPRAAGHIVDSNAPMLAALVRCFGGEPVPMGIVRDDEKALESALSAALQQPVVLTAGGMSMGTHDLVPRVAERLGISWRFHGVRIRPGKPIAYGLGPNGQHIFGLPGNPVSSYVCAWLFARMAIRGLAGHAPLPPHRWRATLCREVPAHRDSRMAFVPARAWNDVEAGLMADPCAWRGSDDPFGLAQSNALMVLTNPTAGLPAGSTVEVIFTSCEP